jgi:hypothetical protein
MLASALGEVLVELRRRGCTLASVLEGRVDREVLARAGFAASDDRISLGISARPQLIQKLQHLQPSFAIDLV